MRLRTRTYVRIRRGSAQRDVLGKQGNDRLEIPLHERIDEALDVHVAYYPERYKALEAAGLRE
jgi:hypothetical protein